MAVANPPGRIEEKMRDSQREVEELVLADLRE